MHRVVCDLSRKSTYYLKSSLIPSENKAHFVAIIKLNLWLLSCFHSTYIVRLKSNVQIDTIILTVEDYNRDYVHLKPR